MAVKVLVFGDNGNILRLLTFIKGDRPTTDQDIQVDNIKIQGRPFLLFTIKQLNLVASQAAGVGALIFFLGDGPIYESRNNLLQLLSEAKELDGVPLVIALDSAGKTVNIKEIISELELFKIKNRASMVKEIDFNTPISVYEMFEWSEAQAQTSRGSQLFDAQPRVVKAKPKYREDAQPSEKTYEELMQDKKFKGLSSVEQEQKYLGLEKQRIKENSMQTQLANFNKNKKKMTPYQIKPSPNPRIEPNLNFFLKDSQNQKAHQVNIKIQTDDFKQKPKSPRYIPKKTGVDISTQVEDNELFDFDRQVQPILNVLITKTLQLSSLEIQEEQEMLKMVKYKQMYNEKRKKEKQHYKEQLKAEEQRIAAKDELLKKHRHKETSKIECFKKVQAYNISGKFLSKLHHDVAQNLHYHGIFPNTFENELKTNYLDFLMKNTMVSLENIHSKISINAERQNELEGLFDLECIESLLSQSKKPHERIQQLKAKATDRRLNYSQDRRGVAIYYENKPCYISTFARFLTKFCDKTLDEYNRGQAEKMKELQGKLAQGQITQDVMSKTKTDDLNQLVKNLQGMLLMDSSTLAFTISHNEFESTNQKQRRAQMFVLAINKAGELVESHSIKTGDKLNSKYFTLESELRDPLKPINMDEGILLDLNRLKDQVTTVILGVRLPDVVTLAKPENQSTLKHSSYGLEYYKNSLPINKNSLSTIKLEQLVTATENPDDPNPPIQSALILCYSLSYRPELGGWYLQTLNCNVKGKSGAQETTFISDLVAFQKSCVAADKQQLGDDDEEQQAPKSSSHKSRQDLQKQRKKRSSKVIEPQPIKKVHLSSRCLPISVYSIDDKDIIEKLRKSVEIHFPEFIQNALYGWDVLLKGKSLSQNPNRLKYFKKVGDLTLEKKSEVIIDVSIDEKPGEQEGSHKPEDEVKDD